MYVDQLMQEYRLSMGEINQITSALHKKYIQLRRTIENISEIMSVLTDYATIYTTPVSSSAILTNIKLIPVDSRSFVVIAVVDSGNVKNCTVRTVREYDVNVLEKLSNYLNHRFSGSSTDNFIPEILEKEKELIPVDEMLINPVFEFLCDISGEENDVDVVLGGTSNIFKHPEFNNIDRTKEFLEFVKKDNIGKLKELINTTGDTTSVIIGNTMIIVLNIY